MTRLLAEFDRLYRADAAAPFVDPQGRVRAALLEVVQPAGWAALSPLWQGVQAELGLPAPAIAVSGLDATQLWFSLATPVAAPQVHDFLAALRARFLPDLPAARVRLWPDPASPSRQPTIVPALQASTGNWSAFVSPDLAAIFSDTPWLDVEPGDEGQAALLRPLQSIKPTEFAATLARLGAQASRADAPTSAPAPVSARVAPVADASTVDDDPRGFLLRVMNDDAIDMALRIEAAKALLPLRDGKA